MGTKVLLKAMGFADYLYWAITVPLMLALCLLCLLTWPIKPLKNLFGSGMIFIMLGRAKFQIEAYKLKKGIV